MVRLTTELLARCASSYMKRQRDESRKQYFRRLTHLHLEGRDIDEIRDDLAMCRNLMVLYAYDNALTCVPNLDHNLNLTHLYLQNNNIDRITGLSSLTRLTKLYVSYNCIVVVEGLETLTELQELHIDNQKLPSGEKMLFDIRSVQAIARSLLVLNISGNGVTSLSDLACLCELNQLSAADNRLTDVNELSQLLLMSWRRLRQINVSNNPVCRRAKYRDRLIVAAPAIEMLDGVEVTETTKQFMRSWQANKEAVKQRLETGVASAAAGRRNPPENVHGSMLRKSMSEFYPTAPANYLMPALNRREFQKVLARSHSHHSKQSADGVDQRTMLSDLSGYGTMSDGHVDRGDSATLHHLSLHNVKLDYINGTAPL